jgi:hypothetical protein
MAKSITMCDPPEGWKYGFPKEFPIGITNAALWYSGEGYPQSLIDKGMLNYCRYWTVLVDGNGNSIE